MARTRAFIVAATGGLILALTACTESTSTDSSAGAAPTEGPIAIGAVLDITGPGASLACRSVRPWRCWPRRSTTPAASTAGRSI